MRALILAVCVAGVCALGCSQPNAERAAAPLSAPAEPQAAATPHGDLIIGTPVSYENLTIFPISSKSPKTDDRFITLDEGLAAGTVEIIEVGAAEDDGESAEDDLFGEPSQQAETQQSADADPTEALRQSDQHWDAAQQDGPQQAANQAPQENVDDADDLFGVGDVDGDVNTLMVRNTSGKPLYLMPGEVISGGKQDRTIGQELVIASGDEPVPIDVFCVEHGRWASRGAEDTAAQLAAAADFDPNLSLVVSRTASVHDLATQAERGKFVASVGHLSKDARLAVQEAGAQVKVWEEVATTNSKVGNASESGNFTSCYLSGEVARDVEPYMKALKPAGETNQIVGVAVAVNGRMLSVDVFESTPLFKKFWPKLLKSHALDAVAAKSDDQSNEKGKTIAVEDCVAFLKDVEKANADIVETANGQITKRQSAVGASFSYYDADSLPAGEFGGDVAGAGFGGGGGLGAVHTSVLAR